MFGWSRSARRARERDFQEAWDEFTEEFQFLIAAAVSYAIAETHYRETGEMIDDYTARAIAKNAAEYAQSEQRERQAEKDKMAGWLDTL